MVLEIVGPLRDGVYWELVRPLEEDSGTQVLSSSPLWLFGHEVNSFAVCRTPFVMPCIGGSKLWVPKQHLMV